MAKNILYIISGIKTSWRPINIDYSLHSEVNNLIVPPSGWFWFFYGGFDYFTAQKHPNLRNSVYDYLMKMGLLWSGLLQEKKGSICPGLAALWSFGNIGYLGNRFREITNKPQPQALKQVFFLSRYNLPDEVQNYNPFCYVESKIKVELKAKWSCVWD